MSASRNGQIDIQQHSASVDPRATSATTEPASLENTPMGDSTRPALRLGMFVMPIHDRAKPLMQCVDEDLDLAVQCDRLGFDEFWVGEHHTSAIENIVMPEIFIAKAVAMTSAHPFRPRARLPAIPSSGPRGQPAGVPRPPLARPAQRLFRTRGDPDRHGSLRRQSARDGGPRRRSGGDDSQDLDERSAVTSSRANSGTSASSGTSTRKWD